MGKSMKTNNLSQELIEARVQVITDSLEDFAIILLDPKGCILDWNRGAAHLLGYDESEVVGRAGEIIFTPEDRAAGMPEKEISTAKIQGKAEDERWHLRKDGSRFWGSGYMAAVRNQEKVLLGFVKIFRDRTKQKKISEALEKTNQELEEFTAIASHDLQEPLQTIRTLLDILNHRLKEKVDGEIKKLLDQSRDTISRTQSMIRKLLEYAKAGRAKVPFPEIDLTGALKRALEILKIPLEESEALITHERLPIVQADSFLMVQLFQNLISNAIKYRKKEEPLTIHISSVQETHYWKICVQDNGIGILPEFQDKIFLIFRRLHVSEYPGSGIGLAICKKIIDAHGGNIWVESQLNQGSVFCFTLPFTPLKTSIGV